ncbi:hypothetical protein DIPPA_03453 [Diplonema papillatum]|nr:hypothetical protein DIPPA_03453 [Diplonema papillatum]
MLGGSTAFRVFGTMQVPSAPSPIAQPRPPPPSDQSSLLSGSDGGKKRCDSAATSREGSLPSQRYPRRDSFWSNVMDPTSLQPPSGGDFARPTSMPRQSPNPVNPASGPALFQPARQPSPRTIFAVDPMAAHADSRYPYKKGNLLDAYNLDRELSQLSQLEETTAGLAEPMQKELDYSVATYTAAGNDSVVMRSNPLRTTSPNPTRRPYAAPSAGGARSAGLTSPPNKRGAAPAMAAIPQPQPMPSSSSSSSSDARSTRSAYSDRFPSCAAPEGDTRHSTLSQAESMCSKATRSTSLRVGRPGHVSTHNSTASRATPRPDDPHAAATAASPANRHLSLDRWQLQQQQQQQQQDSRRAPEEMEPRPREREAPPAAQYRRHASNFTGRGFDARSSDAGFAVRKVEEKGSRGGGGGEGSSGPSSSGGEKESMLAMMRTVRQQAAAVHRVAVEERRATACSAQRLSSSLLGHADLLQEHARTVANLFTASITALLTGCHSTQCYASLRDVRCKAAGLPLPRPPSAGFDEPAASRRWQSVVSEPEEKDPVRLLRESLDKMHDLRLARASQHSARSDDGRTPESNRRTFQATRTPGTRTRSISPPSGTPPSHTASPLCVASPTVVSCDIAATPCTAAPAGTPAAATKQKAGLSRSLAKENAPRDTPPAVKSPAVKRKGASLEAVTEERADMPRAACGDADKENRVPPPPRPTEEVLRQIRLVEEQLGGLRSVLSAQYTRNSRSSSPRQFALSPSFAAEYSCR